MIITISIITLLGAHRLTFSLHSFLQIVSIGAGGTQVTNYGSRFSLTGMTGTFTPGVLAGIAAIGTSTNGPPTSDGIGKGAALTGPWDTPFSLQVGPTRYAPMQPRPGTKITATEMKMLYPTSSARLATTFISKGNAVTTKTQKQTFSTGSRENAVGRWFWLKRGKDKDLADTWIGSCVDSTGRHGEVFGKMEGLKR